jgi:threonine dehydratase
LLHPYDNDSVIAGQGTVVDDVLALHPDTKHFVMPIGGGGLATGILRRLDELQRNDITVQVAEASGSNSTTKSLSRGELTRADKPNARYGGSAVQRIGHRAFQEFQRSSNLNIVQVPERDVDMLSMLYLDGRRDLLRETTPNFEPTTLVAVAALRQLRHLQGPITVLGTGRNDHVYPERQTRRYHVPV